MWVCAFNSTLFVPLKEALLSCLKKTLLKMFEKQASEIENKSKSAIDNNDKNKKHFQIEENLDHQENRSLINITKSSSC